VEHHAADDGPGALGSSLPGGAPDQEVERYRLLQRLGGHLSKIKEKRRMPLVLSLLHGYTVPEIAAILDVSFDAAKKRLLRGRRDLLGRLKRDPYCREMLKEVGIGMKR